MCYLNQPVLTSFSVRKNDKLAVRVAQAVWDTLPDDGLNSENSTEFVSNLARITKHTPMRCSAMLSWLGDIKKTKEDALRIAYAVIGYLPCFDNNDDRLEEKYLGDPVFPVYGRFIASRAYYKTPDRPVVDVVFLAMSTILAGRVCLMQFSLPQAERILKKIYVGRSKLESQPHPAELSGCYLTLPSDWLAARIGSIPDISCTTEMRALNRSLCHKRATRKCSFSDSCATCDKGRDQCAIAVRKTTKRRVEDVGGNNNDTERPDARSS